jgi:hypothetical protein
LSAEDRFSKKRLGSKLQSSLEGKKSSLTISSHPSAFTSAVSGYSYDSHGISTVQEQCMNNARAKKSSRKILATSVKP